MMSHIAITAKIEIIKANSLEFKRRCYHTCQHCMLLIVERIFMSLNNSLRNIHTIEWIVHVSHTIMSYSRVRFVLKNYSFNIRLATFKLIHYDS
jgi:hypothetical protein